MVCFHCSGAAKELSIYMNHHTIAQVNLWVAVGLSLAISLGTFVGAASFAAIAPTVPPPSIWYRKSAVFKAQTVTPAAPQSTSANFKVAFIGDQGLTANSQAVLQLIKYEGAQMVLHSGDLDYADNPAAWDAQINSVLGPDFPYFVSIGNHDLVAWSGYQQKLLERLGRVAGASCTGNLGVKSACHYQGLFFLLTGPGVMDTGHDLYIRDQLAQDSSVWSVCSWHKNQRLMQTGSKTDETGWGVYEECRKGGGIVATGHNHSYSRTYLMNNFQTQSVVGTSSVLRITPGESFVFVSGLGGQSIYTQQIGGAWWASIYTASQGATYGALFCTFNDNNQPDHASCYFKNINGQIIDQFEVVSAVESLNQPPVANAGPDQTVTDTDASGGENVMLDGTASTDPDGTIAAYQWEENGVVLGGTPSLTAQFTVGTHLVTLTVTDNGGLTASDTVQVTVAPADQTAPVISGVQTSGVSDTGATVTWLTDEPSDSLVRYGVTAPLNMIASDVNQTTSHSVAILNLTPNTTYLYAVQSEDAAGNVAVDDNSGTYYGFTTTSQNPTVHVADITLQASVSVKGRVRTCRVTTTVGVADQVGQRVAGVTVNGTWSGAFARTVSGLTASTGSVSFVTKPVKNCGTFTFGVDGLSAAGYTYDSSANVEGSDSITP